MSDKTALKELLFKVWFFFKKNTYSPRLWPLTSLA